MGIRNICDWCISCENRQTNSFTNCMMECCAPLEVLIAVENDRNQAQKAKDPLTQAISDSLVGFAKGIISDCEKEQANEH